MWRTCYRIPVKRRCPSYDVERLVLKRTLFLLAGDWDAPGAGAEQRAVLEEQRPTASDQHRADERHHGRGHSGHAAAAGPDDAEDDEREAHVPLRNAGQSSPIVVDGRGALLSSSRRTFVGSFRNRDASMKAFTGFSLWLPFVIARAPMIGERILQARLHLKGVLKATAELKRPSSNKISGSLPTGSQNITGSVISCPIPSFFHPGSVLGCGSLLSFCTAQRKRQTVLSRGLGYSMIVQYCQRLLTSFQIRAMCFALRSARCSR